MGSCLSSDGWAGRPMPQTAFQREARPRRSRSIRRRFSTNSACTAKSDDLGKIPGRMLANGASQIASMFTQQGRKGTNQDAMIVWEEFGSRKDIVLCGVFDGHGPFGHLVARKVRDALPSKLWAQWQSVAKDDDNSRDLNGRSGSIHSEDSVLSSTDGEWKEALDREEGDNRPEIFHTLKESFMKAFKIMDKELKFHPSIDCFCSGSTAVTLVKKGQDLVIGNIGDSRAILGTRTEDNTLTAVQLTVDFKPNLPNEAERIRKCRGRVFALHDEPDVARVWLPNNDSPGLAMARAFGDFCLKDFGLISVPDVSYRRLTEKDEFIVLATDGVWDVLSNNEVIDIVASARSRSSAAKALVECAVRSWKLKYPTSRIDDCAVVCLFLDNPSSSEQHLNFGTSQSSSAPQLSREISVTAASLHEGEQSGSRSSVDSDTFALDRANSVRNLRTQSQRKLSEFLATDEEEEWSALEGVTRVNSLLNIPRFRGAPNVGGQKKHV